MTFRQNKRKQNDISPLSTDGFLESTSPDNAIEDSLSSKLNKMSLQERSLALNDLHGVADAEYEAPEMLQKKVLELTQILVAKITHYRKGDEDISALLKAIEMSPEYVERMKLVCLRSDCYDAAKAALRMVRFFDHKRELFGETRLVREIQLRDLDEETMDALEKGLFQILRLRDRSGRLVLFTNGRLRPDYSTRAMNCGLFYLIMDALKEEENQRKGIVIIYSAIGQKSVVRGGALELIRKYFARPMRCIAIHICLEDNLANLLNTIIAPLMYRLFDSYSLGRLRFQQGSAFEIAYGLMTFGIPKEAIPFNWDGDVDLANHHAFLESKRSNEAAKTQPAVKSYSQQTPLLVPSITKESIQSPGPLDVITGRGRHPKGAEGHLLMQDLLLEYMEAYERSPRREKMMIADLVLERMKESGCRILRLGRDGTFEEYNDSEARTKICHDFRNRKMLRKVASGGNK